MYYWLRRGGSVRVYNLEIPNARVATNHFLQAKYILALKETLKRKEKKEENFNRALKEIKKKNDAMVNETMKSLIEQMAFKQRITSFSTID